MLTISFLGIYDKLHLVEEKVPYALNMTCMKELKAVI